MKPPRRTITTIEKIIPWRMKGSIGYRPGWLASISPFGLGKGEGQDWAGQHGAREAHDWFLEMMREHEEFEVETDVPGEWPIPVCSETVRQVVVE